MTRCIKLAFSVVVGVFVYTWILDDDRYDKLVYDHGYIEMCHVNTQNVPTSIPEAKTYLAEREKHREAYFFTETSCLGRLNALEACAVESAAILHPEADIYVILISPPEDVSLNSSMKNLVKYYNNIHVLYVHLEDYIRDSILEKWYNSGGLNKVMFHHSYMKALLRQFTAWKFGGTVIDLDIVLMKPLKGLSNFVGAQHNFIVPGVINFGSARSPMAHEFLKEVTGNCQANNNTEITDRVIQSICGAKEKELCDNFLMMPSNAFYPVHKMKWKGSGDTSQTELKIRGINNVYGIHAWNNKFSASRRNFKHVPKQFYTLIAKQFCPNVYENNGNIF